MILRKVEARIFDEECKLEVMEFDVKDATQWKVLFDKWRELKMGMREYQSREPNFPEGLSEVAFCLWNNSARLISSSGLSNTSFDTVDLKTNRAEQIKACSVEKDLTSFGPRSRWDDLYFLDFYAGGVLDGSFDVYKLDTEMIYNYPVNRNQLFKDQQAEGKRPRLVLKYLIRDKNIKPIASNIKVWELL
jgi:hypothetical protein